MGIFGEGRRGPEHTPSRENERNEIAEAFREAGINAIAPKVGTPVYGELSRWANQYIALIALMESPRVRGNAEKFKELDTKRSIAHNALCIKIYGKSKAQVSHREKIKAANFACYFMDRTEYLQ